MLIRPRIHSRQALTAIAVMASALASGCGLNVETTESGWPTVRLPAPETAVVKSRYEPRVEAVSFRHDVTLTPGESGLSAEEGERLAAFLNRNRVGRDDRINLVTPPTDAVADPQTARLVDMRREALAAFLKMQGIKSNGVVDVDPSPAAGDVVAVDVRRYVVHLPACPDWSSDPAKNYENAPHSNFGCATAVNLGMMVAEPGDLVRGRAYEPMDGERAAMAIERYRKGTTTSLTPENVGIIEGQQKTDGGSSGADSGGQQ